MTSRFLGSGVEVGHSAQRVGWEPCQPKLLGCAGWKCLIRWPIQVQETKEKPDWDSCRFTAGMQKKHKETLYFDFPVPFWFWFIWIHSFLHNPLCRSDQAQNRWKSGGVFLLCCALQVPCLESMNTFENFPNLGDSCSPLWESLSTCDYNEVTHWHTVSFLWLRCCCARRGRMGEPCMLDKFRGATHFGLFFQPTK